MGIKKESDSPEKIIVTKEVGFKKILIGFVVGLIIGALAVFFIMRPNMTTVHGHAGKDDADVVLRSGDFGVYTVADFQEAILGKASQNKELIVMEQPLDITTTLTNSGLFSWDVFSMVKDVKFYGTGVYTVDLSKIDASDISVDTTNRTVILTIPHSCLHYINPELEKTEFEDTKKGFLAIGDITLTAEENNILENEIINKMREKLTTPELYEQADKYAEMTAWEIFQPSVTSISPDFAFSIQFDEETSNMDISAE
ncbi:MAG: DUF4230 domain-containing protein [Lachnospiraceae bacterium]|nr:DUF4230 domain-containing protein [Lachnospiraceae bacterium]